MTNHTLDCSECQETFERSSRELRKSGSDRHFCSRSCSVRFNNRVRPKRARTNSCAMCKTKILRGRKHCPSCLPKYYESVRSNSQRVASKKKVKDRVPHKKCLVCKKKCFGRTCKSCYAVTMSNYTLKELINKNSHQSSAFAAVRSRARTVGKNMGWNACKICGYSKHIEIAHIHPISSFSIDTLISEINHIENLAPLCRNCHWEFDHGMITF